MSVYKKTFEKLELHLRV